MIIIGHRGARGLAPENTVASLKKALESNVDWIEFDVRITGDKIPILYHDFTVVDSTGNKFPVSDCSYKDFKNHKPDLATLREALRTVDGSVPLYIEVKQSLEVEPIVEVLSTYGHRYFLASKSQRTLVRLHKALPKVPKIVIESWSGVRATRRAKQVNTRILSMYQLFLWPGFIRAMQRRGYELYTYTINNPAKARRWAKHGLAGVITDYPDRFKN